MEFYAFACLDSGELLQICTKTKMRARLQPDSDEPATTARGGTVPVANLVPFGSYREVRILQIACGRQHICAIDRKGRIFAWWGNKLGQCGTGKRSVKPIKSPRQIKRFGVGELMRTADTMKVQHIVDLFAPHASVHLPLPLSHLLAFFPLQLDRARELRQQQFICSDAGWLRLLLGRRNARPAWSRRGHCD